MKQAICAALLLLASFDGVAAEVPVSSVEFGGLDSGASVVALASSDDVALLVWNESRPVSLGSTRTRAVAVRLDASGRTLDRIPFLVSSDDAWAVAAAWTGSVFLVAWNTAFDSRLTVVGSDGQVRRTIELGAPAARLDCHANGCLVTLSAGYPWARTLDTIVLDREGAVRVPRQTVAQLPGNITGMASATDGTSYLVAWSTSDPNAVANETLHYLTIGDDGRLRSEFSAAATGRAAAATSDGSGYVIASWQRSGLVWQRLNGEGDKVGASVRPETPALTTWSRVQVIPLSGRFLLVSGTTIHSFDESGKIVAAPSTHADLATLAAARMGDRIAVVSSHSSSRSVVARSVGADAQQVGETRPIEVSARPQSAPVAALDAGRLFTVWTERVDGRSQVRMSVLRDAVTREVEQWVAPSAASQENPSVAFDGSACLVVWTESGAATGVMARRFTTAGVPLDAAPVRLSDQAVPFGTGAYAASDGRDFVVVWTEKDAASAATRVVAARWTPAGATAKAEVAARPSGVTADGIAWDGTQYVVLWRITTLLPIICDPGGCWQSELRATLMGCDGTVADRSGIQIAPDMSPDRRAELISTSDGTVVTWVASGIGGRLLRRDGTLGSARVLASEKELIFGSSIARVGSQLFLAWSTFAKVQGTFVSPDASWAGPPIALAETAATSGDRPVVADLGRGQIALVFQRLTDDAEHGTAPRLFVRTATVSAPRQRGATVNAW